MAQSTLTYIDASGATQTLECTNGVSYKIPNNIICDASGHFLPAGDAVGRAIYHYLTDGVDTAGINDVDGALDERSDVYLQTASCIMGIDAAAGAGSQLVPIQVVSTAVPNLRVAHYNSTNAMPAGDAAGRAIYHYLTDGTDTAGIIDVDAAVDERLDQYVCTASALFGLDSGAAAGSQSVPVHVVTTTNNLAVTHRNGTNAMPAGDATARSIFTQITDATTGPVAVKAASTAAGATDKALVVSLSPNSPIYTTSEGGGAASAAGTAATKSLIVGGAFTAYGSLPAATTTQQLGLQLTKVGTLKTATFPGGTPVYAGSGSVGAATATATLTIPAAVMGYLDGFDVDGSGATAGSAIALTITGLLGGTLTYAFGVPAGATVPVHQSFRFDPPLQASAVNTDIVVSAASFGVGNLAASVTAYGRYI